MWYTKQANFPGQKNMLCEHSNMRLVIISKSNSPYYGKVFKKGI